MHKKYITIAALLGGTGVALGAFGAHGLQRITEDEKILHGYQTAVQYQLWHALALLCVGILFEKFSNKMLNWSANCFIVGTLLFSGSLYLLTFLKIQDSSMVKFVGPVTPLGGVFFILGWLLLLLSVSRSK